jgi:type I restriction enzyme S subunit
MKLNGDSGARADRLAIKDEIFKQMPIPYPNKIEQQKIGSFFTQLDDLIALHQQKLTHLQERKKGLLQKMFPKAGEKVPELRFPGFSGDWEEKKLGEVAIVNSGRDYKHLNNGTVPVYGTGGYMLSVDDALSYDTDGIGIGRKGTIDMPFILRAPFWTVDTLFYVIPKNNFDLDYLYAVFQNINWKKLDESTGVPSLSKTTIVNVSQAFPIFKEQQKIGTFFKKIDNSILLQQQKLEHLKDRKKALLQQMFV